MCLLKVWKLLLLRMRMPKSENAFENKSQVTLQRWPEKMEDEKGLVAREWLYTKVRWCQLSSRLKLWWWGSIILLISSLDSPLDWILSCRWWMDEWKYKFLSQSLIQSFAWMHRQKGKMRNSGLLCGYICGWCMHFQIIDASQKKYCGKLCGLVLAGGNSIKSASVNIFYKINQIWVPKS